MITAKQMLKSVVPPALWRLGLIVTGRQRDRFDYLADAATAHLPGGEQYWSQFIAQERIACETLMTRARARQPLLSSNPDEGLKYAIYGYALAIAALGGRKRLTVLDYGGNLGDYYWLATMLGQGIEIDFHCKELPAIADAGRAINTHVTWHTDESCLSAAYDLVMFNSSIQYVKADTLLRAARAGRYLLLSDVPAVRNVPAFFSTQRQDRWATVQRHPNVSEIIATATGAGLRLVWEIHMGSHPHVRGAPEQPVCLGWFFQRI